MATLVLSTVGSALGGPLGHALGGLIGRQIDREIFGGPGREGPRLTELAVTTSSYGNPLPRHFGRMRVAGTVIWATDLQEDSMTEGGKGEPSVTTYTYSANFAVALSSTPLSRLGRIWADGNLLRGEQGDLKVEGEMRAYLGGGADPVDPLIAAERGSQAPAFRDCAYVVFEGLQLADYGNRIPALTFEIFSSQDDRVSLSEIAPQAMLSETDITLSYARGFADDGGPVVASLQAINQVMPLSCITTDRGISLSPVTIGGVAEVTLREQLASIADANTTERNKERVDLTAATPLAIRYYDEERDYQPGVQRAVGMRPNGQENLVDLPATMTSSGARQLANENAQRVRWYSERVTWRMGVLDPAVHPGSIVRLPNAPGQWRVMTWEWYERGVELGLERAAPPNSTATPSSDPGPIPAPTDLPAAATHLAFIESPSDGTSDPSKPLLFAAVSAETAEWSGASLFSVRGNSVLPIGNSNRRRAVLGELTTPLGASRSLLFEPNATLTVELVGDELGFEPTDIDGIAAGTNRALVGSEVLQFLDCEQQGPNTWQLSGLLRGRAGTETQATREHVTGTPFALLDSRLTAFDQSQVSPQPGSQIAAFGRGDSAFVYSTLANAGLSRRPLAPVHARIAETANDSWELCWTRRARGQWVWQGSVETALVEEQESYRIGYGDLATPFAQWSSSQPSISFSAGDRATLLATHGPAELWVQQVGTYSLSDPLLLANLT